MDRPTVRGLQEKHFESSLMEQIMYASQIEMSLDVSSLQNVLSSHAADNIL